MSVDIKMMLSLGFYQMNGIYMSITSNCMISSEINKKIPSIKRKSTERGLTFMLFFWQANCSDFLGSHQVKKNHMASKIVLFNRIEPIINGYKCMAKELIRLV